LERLVRTFASEHDEVYVTTGPLFIPTFDPDTGTWEMRHSFIGMEPWKSPEDKTGLADVAPGIAVPTHFFKIIAIKVPVDSTPRTRALTEQPQQVSSCLATSTRNMRSTSGSSVSTTLSVLVCGRCVWRF
jgi:DNA/RNA endonuclease G (NUC1)